MGPVAPHQRRALDRARERVQRTLEAHFPRFTWLLPVIVRPREPGVDLEEPVAHFLEAAHEREVRSWDFALVVTPGELRAYYKSFALGVPSRALFVSVLSLARLAVPEGPEGAERSEARLARRIETLALHLFGDMNGLWHRDAPDAVMHAPEAVSDLEAPRGFAPEELARLGAALEEVADLRLEEAGAPGSASRFYLRAAWTQIGEIASAVHQARPWEFPLRLSRLTAAALSALFLLLVTAEVWDLGMAQPPALVALISAAALGLTTPFILARQKLVLRRTRRTLTEQVVVANVSAALIVFLGMCTTYLLLFGLTLAAGLTLYSPELIARWAPSVGAAAGPRHLAVLAGLVSSLGLLIGSLGASFEGNHYFQHVIYADEET